MNTYYLLRHSKANIDPSKPPSEWTLSEDGRASLQRFARRPLFREVNFVYSSTETKAYSTAKMIAYSLQKKVSKMVNFNELNRNKGGFISKYENALREAFSNIQESRNNWEPCQTTLERFKEGIEILNQKHDHKKILVVSHGIALTLYFAFLKEEMGNLLSRWKKLRFLDYGIVKDSRVVRDIID